MILLSFLAALAFTVGVACSKDAGLLLLPPFMALMKYMYCHGIAFNFCCIEQIEIFSGTFEYVVPGAIGSHTLKYVQARFGSFGLR